MITQGKDNTLSILLVDLKTLQDELYMEGLKPYRTKEIKEEIIAYAELFDKIRLSNVAEEDKETFSLKKKIELRLLNGKLKIKLQEVIKEFIGKVEETIEQDQ